MKSHTLITRMSYLRGLVIILFTVWWGGCTTVASTSHLRPIVPLCGTVITCEKKSDGECALNLYLESKQLSAAAHMSFSQKLYLSAKVNLRKAMCCLKAAQKRAKKAKLATYSDYQMIMNFNLEKKITHHINECEGLLRKARWK